MRSAPQLQPHYSQTSNNIDSIATTLEFTIYALFIFVDLFAFSLFFFNSQSLTSLDTAMDESFFYLSLIFIPRSLHNVSPGWSYGLSHLHSDCTTDRTKTVFPREDALCVSLLLSSFFIMSWVCYFFAFRLLTHVFPVLPGFIRRYFIGWCFHHSWKVFGHYFSKYIFCPIFCLYPPFRTSVTCI